MCDERSPRANIQTIQEMSTAAGATGQAETARTRRKWCILTFTHGGCTRTHINIPRQRPTGSRDSGHAHGTGTMAQQTSSHLVLVVRVHSVRNGEDGQEVPNGHWRREYLGCYARHVAQVLHVATHASRQSAIGFQAPGDIHVMPVASITRDETFGEHPGRTRLSHSPHSSRSDAYVEANVAYIPSIMKHFKSKSGRS